MTDDIMKKSKAYFLMKMKYQKNRKSTKNLKKKLTKLKNLKKSKKQLKHRRKTKKEPLRKGTSMVEIFFDGIMEIQGTKIKIVPGGEVESDNLKFVFDENSVKIYEI
jgi:hypothetical protein